jgi:hypothetical protein
MYCCCESSPNIWSAHSSILTSRPFGRTYHNQPHRLSKIHHQRTYRLTAALALAAHCGYGLGFEATSGGVTIQN